MNKRQGDRYVEFSKSFIRQITQGLGHRINNNQQQCATMTAQNISVNATQTKILNVE